MNDAGLDHGLGPGRFDDFGQSSQTIAAHDQDIVHAPVGQLGTYVGPKCCSFIGLDPDAQHMHDALHVHSDRQVSDPVLHCVIASEFDADRVQVDHRVEHFYGAVLPLSDGVTHRVSNRGNRCGTDLHADGGNEVMGGYRAPSSPGIQADNRRIQAIETPLSCVYQAWGERACPIPGNLDLKGSHLRYHGLLRRTVPRVRARLPTGLALLLPQVLGKLSSKAALQGLLQQRRQQPLAARHLDLASIKTLKQRRQRPRATQLLRSLTRTSARHNNILIHLFFQTKRRIHRQLNTPYHLIATIYNSHSIFA